MLHPVQDARTDGQGALQLTGLERYTVYGENSEAGMSIAGKATRRPAV
jgi:predicted chitinase